MAPSATESLPSPHYEDEKHGTELKSHKVQMPKFDGFPRFDNPYEEREYMKGRLALAFRIFAKFGFDEGVAGHITLRVSFIYLINKFIG